MGMNGQICGIIVPNTEKCDHFAQLCDGSTPDLRNMVQGYGRCVKLRRETRQWGD